MHNIKKIQKLACTKLIKSLQKNRPKKGERSIKNTNFVNVKLRAKNYFIKKKSKVTIDNVSCFN